MELAEEIWKDILGYEGLYQVSNLGRLKSISRSIVMPHGGIKHLPLKIMKSRLNRHDYAQCILSKNGFQKNHYVHILVATAFINNSESKPEVNHRNGIKDDNRSSNLEWVTGSDNVRHSFDTLGKVARRGAANKDSKPVIQMNSVCMGLACYASIGEAARETGIKKTSIQKCLSGTQKTAGGFIWKFKAQG